MSVPTIWPEGPTQSLRIRSQPRAPQPTSSARAGSVVDLREELPSGGLPDKRLQPEAFQLRRLVAQRVLLRHRPQYLRSGLG